ncbi:NAD-dependent DNA ligase [Deefgea piscis]|uniref:NAD-dependent DNA ligase n=1 Tax=Deefgea piscis TaxID=2739061 RepID=A0A6M8SJQ4_9NEIS|nr:BRCT domain-containing protein [Deefgea piscis]QKJ65275.1 NAD-dependent DNA ligase [Deefgea piscis]
MDDLANASVIKSLAHQNAKKATEHLLGICQGIMADQVLSDQEIHFLSNWVKQNPAVTENWPGKTIARRLHEILFDGVITKEERESLIGTLTSLCNNDFAETGDAQTMPIGIPFDDDPHIIFDDRLFCFTGSFYFGTRSACERAVEKLTAQTKGYVTRDVDYLVVGSQINADWKHSSYGNKIETAMNYIEKGCGIALISEQQWVEALSQIK